MTPRPWGTVFVCPACRGGLREAGEGAVCRSCAAAYPQRDGILHLLAGREGAPGFDPHYFATLAAVEERHFWFRSRREVIRKALQRTVPDLSRRGLFDIGCGSGGLLRFLGASGIPLAGACDAYVESLAIVGRRVDAPLALVDEGRLPPLAEGQRLVGLFDVLEHIDDDRGTLAFLHRVLEPGGILVLTVPAHPFLFDEMDELAHHRRRYRREELRERMEAAGLRVLALTHFMAPLVPLLLGLRAVGRVLGRLGLGAASRRSLELRVTPVVNEVMAAVLAVEGWLIDAGLPMPFGSSLVAVAVRRS